MSQLNRMNHEQRVYVLDCGTGYTCLGFDYAEKRRSGVLQWLGQDNTTPYALGTAEHYAAYEEAMA